MICESSNDGFLAALLMLPVMLLLWLVAYFVYFRPCRRVLDGKSAVVDGGVSPATLNKQKLDRIRIGATNENSLASIVQSFNRSRFWAGVMMIYGLALLQIVMPNIADSDTKYANAIMIGALGMFLLLFYIAASDYGFIKPRKKSGFFLRILLGISLAAAIGYQCVTLEDVLWWGNGSIAACLFDRYVYYENKLKDKLKHNGLES